MTNRDQSNKSGSAGEPNAQAGSSRNQEQKQSQPGRRDETGDVERKSDPSAPVRTPKNPGLPQYDDRPTTAPGGERRPSTPDFGDASPSDPRRLEVSDRGSPDAGSTSTSDSGAGNTQA